MLLTNNLIGLYVTQQVGVGVIEDKITNKRINYEVDFIAVCNIWKSDEGEAL